MGGAVTLKNDDHVRMDLIYERCRSAARREIDLVTIGCLIFYLGVMLIGSISSLQYAIETNETPLLDLEPVDDPDQGADGRLHRADAAAGRLPGLQAHRDPARRATLHELRTDRHS